MLEVNGFRFVGPSATSCAVAMDKILTKLIIQQIGLSTPDYTIVHRCDWEQDKEIISDEFISELGLPVFIKSPDLGSSYGLGIADNKKEAIDLADRLFEKAHRIIVEQYIEGIELTVPVLGNSSDGSAEALPVIMIVPKKTRFFDLEAKYDNSITDEITPAPIDDYIKNRCQEEALQIYYALDCDGLSRIDLMWADDKAYWLEVNPIPGFTSASLYPKSAAAHGLDYPRLLDRLIELSVTR
jgi:D-alanine-D-alanine ligase